jgi:predicted ATP-grasp superfamily ATP-dependent carboligase
MNRTPILVLANHNDWLTAYTLYCLGQSQLFELHLLSRKPKNPFRFLPGIKSNNYFPREASDTALVAFARQVAEKTKAKVLVPISDRGFRWAIQYKELLQQFIALIPLPEPWAYTIASDKGQLATFMKQNAIPTPLTLTDLTGNLEEKLEGIPFPVLLKPKVGAGGKGKGGEPPITYFPDKAALLTFISHHQVIAHKYIVQAFVKGYVIGCNVLYKKGQLLTYTIQKSVIPIVHFGPSWGIEFINNKEVIGVVDALLSKLQWNGVANIDLICDADSNSIKVLEINARFWQTIVGSMVRSGINFPSLACLVALHGTVEQAPARLGKYIPLGHFLKYKMSSAFSNPAFNWKEADLRLYFMTLLSRAYVFYQKSRSK